MPLIPKYILDAVKFKVRQLMIELSFVPDLFETRYSWMQTRCLVCKMGHPRTLLVGHGAAQ